MNHHPFVELIIHSVCCLGCVIFVSESSEILISGGRSVCFNRAAKVTSIFPMENLVVKFNELLFEEVTIVDASLCDAKELI